MRKTLVKLADKFDREGKTDLANSIDNLLSVATRQKAPLKNLDEDVKKDLFKFIHKVKSNIEDSMEALEEFFRRMRYFDMDESVKDLKLDKALKELSKTHECMDGASKSMYALTYGKYPSKSDLEQMAEDFGSEKNESDGPLDFFESQKKNPTHEEDDLSGAYVKPDEMEEDEGVSDEEYEKFMKEMYESDKDEEAGESFED